MLRVKCHVAMLRVKCHVRQFTDHDHGVSVFTDQDHDVFSS